MSSTIDELKELDVEISQLLTKRLKLFEQLGIPTQDSTLPFRDLRGDSKTEQSRYRALADYKRVLEHGEGTLIIYRKDAPI
jgi:hypothetical protein